MGHRKYIKRPRPADKGVQWRFIKVISAAINFIRFSASSDSEALPQLVLCAILPRIGGRTFY